LDLPGNPEGKRLGEDFESKASRDGDNRLDFPGNPEGKRLGEDSEPEETRDGDDRLDLPGNPEGKRLGEDFESKAPRDGDNRLDFPGTPEGKRLGEGSEPEETQTGNKKPASQGSSGRDRNREDSESEDPQTGLKEIDHSDKNNDDDRNTKENQSTDQRHVLQQGGKDGAFTENSLLQLERARSKDSATTIDQSLLVDLLDQIAKLQQNCQMEQALALRRQVVVIGSRVLPAGSPAQIEFQRELAALLRVTGRLQEARMLELELSRDVGLGTSPDELLRQAAKNAQR
jgi:hypothetical protein